MPVWMGIDPGANGGIAIIRNGVVEACRMPADEKGIWNKIRQVADMIADESWRAHCLLERVHAMPGDGVSGMFRFGVSYGGLRMALIAANITFSDVEPRAWQKALGIEPRSTAKAESRPDFKRRMKDFASTLCNGYKLTLATCDAFLLAYECQRRYATRR